MAQTSIQMDRQANLKISAGNNIDKEPSGGKNKTFPTITMYENWSTCSNVIVEHKFKKKNG